MDLRLTITDDIDDSSLHHASANRLAAIVATTTTVVAAIAGCSNNVDGRALFGPVAVIKVVEVAREASVKLSSTVKSKRAVLAERKPRGFEGVGLRRAVKLELIVGGNVTGSVVGILQNAVLESHDQSAFTLAGSLLWVG